jgi:hypothetical protein
MMVRRSHRTERRAPRRPSLPQILVVCNGVRTEPRYFEGLRNHLRRHTFKIKIVSKGVSPRQLVEHAIDLRRREPDQFDEVWCVFDVDEFDISDAAVTARRSRIELAVSNPCFELWLLLHHEEHRAHLAGYQDVVVRLKRKVPAYDKCALDFGDYVRGLADAVVRGRALDPESRELHLNPSTGVWRLVEKIMGEDHE